MHGFRILCSHFVHIVFAFCSLFVRIRCLLCADFVLTWCLLCAYYGSHWAAGRPGTTFAGHWISPKDVKQTSKNEWHKYKLHEWKQEAQTLIRPRRRSPNAVCHFPQKRKISLKLLSSGLPLSEWRGTFHTMVGLTFSQRKQGQMIQKMLQQNVRRALGPDISFSMFSQRNKEGWFKQCLNEMSAGPWIRTYRL
jgi:hypothetical protein